MKVNIAVPCYNEQEAISKCINDLESLEKDYCITVCNDGSTDGSLQILKNKKNIRILSSKVNYGLAEVFNSIVHDSVSQNFDYLIIFDADNQYPYDEIDSLLKTSINKKYDICLGSRNFKKNNVFTKFKNLIQIIGTKVISLLLRVDIKDSTTGFRCYSSKALEDLFVLNRFSYTVESLFVAKKNKLNIGNYKLNNFYLTRESRLFKNNKEYVLKTIKILSSSILLYKKSFLLYLYLLTLTPGVILCSRFILNYLNSGGEYNGNIQSLLIGTSTILISTIFYSSVMSLSYAKSNLREILVGSFKPKHTVVN
jgi:dolichol-phosphate mannosyltransferase